MGHTKIGNKAVQKQWVVLATSQSLLSPAISLPAVPAELHVTSWAFISSTSALLPLLPPASE